MRIYCAVILLVLLGLLRQTGVAQAAPVPTYDILDCSVSQCNFGPVSSAPTGSPQPTQGDFQSFLGQQLGQDLSADTFFWQAAGSNSPEVRWELRRPMSGTGPRWSVAASTLPTT